MACMRQNSHLCLSESLGWLPRRFVLGSSDDYSFEGQHAYHKLYSEAHVTFEDDAGAYDQTDAAGFIQLNALRLKLLAARNRRLG